MLTRYVASAAGMAFAALCGLVVAAPVSSASHPVNDEAHGGGGTAGIPASLEIEHQEIHEELSAIIASGGKAGEAARALADVLHPHFLKEQKIAMPPLGVLGDLAAGKMSPEIIETAKLAQKLKEDLPEMLKEHEAIRAAAGRLADAGKAENNKEAVRFAEKLGNHARTEEEVLYPAAILVGDYVRLRTDS